MHKLEQTDYDLGEEAGGGRGQEQTTTPKFSLPRWHQRRVASSRPREQFKYEAPSASHRRSQRLGILTANSQNGRHQQTNSQMDIRRILWHVQIFRDNGA